MASTGGQAQAPQQRAYLIALRRYRPCIQLEHIQDLYESWNVPDKADIGLDYIEAHSKAQFRPHPQRRSRRDEMVMRLGLDPESIQEISHPPSRYTSDLEVHERQAPLHIRGIGTDYHQASQYVMLPMHFIGWDETGQEAAVQLVEPVVIVRDLKANILIRTNVLGPHEIDILTSTQQVTFARCGITVQATFGNNNHQ
ncbi:hypothetical protein CDD82_2524 [Ophiocordyceps australis]|uniref:Uncharacterized protein n=1 Tax=Ophiocordyceps australis TaxID=1399860 RepID=A0A2C5ZGT6_9HYPO|nr:hypothetical protein CDD82_2524 [Ophiocordyceps australis]